MKKDNTFRDNRRLLTSWLTPLERRTLDWLVRRTPRSIHSDHMTLLALAAMVMAGAAYALSGKEPRLLHLVNLGLFLHWLGDSLDGNLARHRNRQRPRYGFYVDHILDCFSAALLLGGLALSGWMSPWAALALLAAFLLLSANSYLAAYTLGDFRMSFLKFGPTEARLLLACGNLSLLYFDPVIGLAGRRFLLFDLGGIVAAAFMIIVLIRSTIQNSQRLYRMERL
ncbi:MAG TPA: CDP-alcohol phosphatidyltransferase family protein [Acidobacteriota bacterium]|nr:CDP-alcohol phosphatidyltransferase family protein [Acidobacteriota bacterium]